MKKYGYIAIGFILAVVLMWAGLVHAQGATLWQLVGNKLAPVVSSWGLRIPSLGSSGNPCVKVDASGNFATTTCGSGGITSLNGLSGTTQTFTDPDDTNVTLTVNSSGTNHAFTLGWTGVLGVSRGGTNISNPTAAGVMVGSYAGGGWQQIATSSLGLLTTHVAEGSNLYWTQGRFDTAFGNKSTTDLTEGTNLYYTQARFDTAFSAKSTTNLAEGTNLYFTDERVDDRVDALIVDGTGITTSYNDGANSLTINSTLGVSISPAELADADFGDFTVSAGVAGIDANAVALTTDTTGNYVGTLADSGGGTLTISGSGSEGASVTAGINLGNANLWTALQRFNNATSSLFSAYSAFFGGTATSTFNNAGDLFLGGKISGGGLSDCDADAQTLGWDTTTGLFTCGDDDSGAAASPYEIATTSDIAVPQVAYFTKTAGITTLGSVATGTISGAGPITITGSRYVLGGSATVGVTADSIGNTELAFDTGQALTTVSSPTFAALTLTAPLTVPNGGTGWANVQAGGLLYGAGTGRLATTTQGTGGQILAWLGGIPTWTATTTFSGGLTYSGGNVTADLGTSITVGELASADFGSFTCNGAACTVDAGAISNTMLANSTISGVALGSNLNALTNDATLNGSSYNGSSAISDWGLNLANPNSWTGLQQFANASSTIFSAYRAYFGGTATSTFDTAGVLTLATPLAVTSGGTGASSLNNLITLGTHTTGDYLATLSSSGSITVTGSGESAAATVNLNMANANNWTALQTFVQASSTRFSVFDTAYFGGTATSTFNSAGTLTLAGSLIKGADTINDFSGFGLAVASNALGLDQTGAADGECLKYVSAGPATAWDTCGGGGSSKWTEGTQGGRTVTYLTTLTSDLLVGGNSTSTSGFWFDRVATTTKIGQYGQGDSVMQFTTDGTATTTIGQDYSDNKYFKISANGQLGVNDALIIGPNRVATTSIGLWAGSGGTLNTVEFSGGDIYVQDELEVDGAVLLSSTLAVTGIGTHTGDLRVDEGIIVDDDGAFVDVSAGSVIIGDGSDTGTLEIEDGPACIGDAGCTPNATDGSLLVENVGYFVTGLAIDSDATFPTPSAGSLIVGDGTDTFTVEFEDGPLCVGDGGCTPYAGDGTIMAEVGIGIASSTVPTPGIEFWFNGQAIFQGLTTAAGTPNSLCLNATTKEVTENAATSCVVSSARFKHDIGTLDINALDVIAKIDPSHFVYNDATKERWGLIAENLAEADKHLAEYDAEGRPHTIDIPALLGTLVKAVQELADNDSKIEERMAAMEARIIALEAENADLKRAPVNMCSVYGQ